MILTAFADPFTTLLGSFFAALVRSVRSSANELNPFTIGCFIDLYFSYLFSKNLSVNSFPDLFLRR